MYFNETKFIKDREDFGLFIKVSEYCNLRCSFCYQNSPEGTILKPESYKTCFENIDYYIKKVKEIRDSKISKYAKLQIIMFGGEPTMNPQGIKDICNYIHDKYCNKPEYEFLSVSMTTNGVIYNPEIGKYLFHALNKKCTLLISCDFNKIKADENRKIKGKENESAYEQIMKNIKLYEKDENFFDIKISSVLSDLDEESKDTYYKIIENESKIIKSKLKKGFKQLNMHQNHEFQDENSEYNKYLKKYADEFYKVCSLLISNLNKQNFTYSMTLIKDQFLSEGYIELSECFCMSAIDSKGNFNFCNSNKATPDGNTDPEAIKKIILNPDFDVNLYPCNRKQQNYGSRYKTKVVKELNALLDSVVIRIPLISLVVNDGNLLSKESIEKINLWIEYTELGYIPNTNERYKIRVNSEFKEFLTEENLNKVELIDFIDPTAIYINEKGDILASVLMQDLKLNSIYEKTNLFMYSFVEDLNKKDSFIKKLFEEI